MSSNITNIKIGSNDPDAIMFSDISESGLKYDFREWELNEDAGHVVEVTKKKIIIKKVRPNVWILRSNYKLSTGTDTSALCAKTAKTTLSISGITDSVFASNDYFIHHSCVSGSGGSYGSMRGFCIMPMLRKYDADHLVHTTYPEDGANRLELPFSAYIWDSMTLNDDTTVQVASENILRSNGGGYNMYGRITDGIAIQMFPDWKSFPTPYGDWEVGIGLYTGLNTFACWQNGNNTHPYSITTTTRGVTGSNVGAIVYTDKDIKSIKIKVEGLVSGDRLELGRGIIEESPNSILNDGIYTLTPVEGVKGFKLYGNNSVTSEVKITLLNMDGILDEEDLIDISDNPITIEISQDYYKPWTKECWQAFVVGDCSYYKEKTVEGCLRKYGYLVDKTLSYSNEFTAQVSEVKTPDGYAEALTDLPEIIDISDYTIPTEDNNNRFLAWRISPHNPEIWSNIVHWYNNNEIPQEVLRWAFRQSSIGDKLTITLSNRAFENTSNTIDLADCLYLNTGVTSIEIRTDLSIIGHNMFRSARALKEFSYKSKDGTTNQRIYGDCSGMFENTPIETLDDTYINFDQVTMTNYMFNNCPNLTKVTFNGSSEPTIICKQIVRQMFAGDSKLVTFGPALEFSNVTPQGRGDYEETTEEVDANKYNAYRVFQSCNAFTTITIVGLNHGDWYLDGTGTGSNAHGNLPNLDKMSQGQLLSMLTDLTTHDETLCWKLPFNSCSLWTLTDKATINTANNQVILTCGTSDDITNLSNYNAYYTYKDNIRENTYSAYAEKNAKITVSGITSSSTKVQLVVYKAILKEYSIVANLVNGQNTISWESLDAEVGDQILLLASGDSGNTDEIIITLPYKFDQTNPIVSSAKLYLPSTWLVDDKDIYSLMCNAKTLGWTVYVGGTEIIES